MIIIPAIDLKDGLCVRLKKGEFNTVHKVAEDPLETAISFQNAGSRYLHIVDLDGARYGNRRNASIVREIIQQTNLNVELGGGIRCISDLSEVIAMGVWRAVLGSAAIENKTFLQDAVRNHGEKIAVGIDAKNGLVRSNGWEKETGVDYIMFAKELESYGARSIIFTDIDTDGMLSGPSTEMLKKLKKEVSCGLYASGGIRDGRDIAELKALEIDGVIIGKALYEGRINLKEILNNNKLEDKK